MGKGVSGLQEINGLLQEIKEELEAKTDLELFEKVIGEQATINDAIFSECGKGKWQWGLEEPKGGDVSISKKVGNEKSGQEHGLWDRVLLKEDHNAIIDQLALSENQREIRVSVSGFFDVLVLGIPLKEKSEICFVLEENAGTRSKESNELEGINEEIRRETEESVGNPKTEEQNYSKVKKRVLLTSHE